MKFLMFCTTLFISISCYGNSFYECETPNATFVIRWAFQNICDWSYDPRRVWPTPVKSAKHATFDPSRVKGGDMIFVRDADAFFERMHPKIKVPYFILTSGEYLDAFKDHYFDYIDDKILGWFTIHPHPTKHPKVFPIPLGIIQFSDLYEKRKTVHQKMVDLRKVPKERLLYMNFTDWKNPERKRIRELFMNQEFCTYAGARPFDSYLREMAVHKFVISPPGLGPDCYRHYESLLVGTIPIVLHSYLDYMYEGLPVLFIDSWEQVTEKFLNEQYEKIISKKYNPERLYTDYWFAMINEIRRNRWPHKAKEK